MFPHQIDYCPAFMGRPTGEIPYYPWGQQEYCGYSDEPVPYGDPYTAQSLTDLRLPPPTGVQNPGMGGMGSTGSHSSPWVANAGLPRIAGSRPQLGRSGEYAAYAEYYGNQPASGVTGYSCGHPGCDQLLQLLYSAHYGLC